MSLLVLTGLIILPLLVSRLLRTHTIQHWLQEDHNTYTDVIPTDQSTSDTVSSPLSTHRRHHQRTQSVPIQHEHSGEHQPRTIQSRRSREQSTHTPTNTRDHSQQQTSKLTSHSASPLLKHHIQDAVIWSEILAPPKSMRSK